MDSHSKALLLDASWSLDNIDERIGDLQDVVRYLYVGNNKAQPCLSKSSEILGSGKSITYLELSWNVPLDFLDNAAFFHRHTLGYCLPTSRCWVIPMDTLEAF